MKWDIPAKTFLLGEYAALASQAAIVVTTKPCFRMHKIPEPQLKGIHPESPAGQYWKKNANHKYGLAFADPWNGIGGLGASSAQFIGAWLAQHTASTTTPDHQKLLADYFDFAWNGEGLRPSGYDVMAQLAGGLFYCNHREKQYFSRTWPFADLDFVLVHSGKKLQTHTHLQQKTLPDCIDCLGQYAENGLLALMREDRDLWIASIQKANQSLASAGLITPHSRQLLTTFSEMPPVLAAKGCGAMGADVIALFFAPEARPTLTSFCTANQLRILARSEDIDYKQNETT